MRLVTFEAGRGARVGVLLDGGSTVVDIAASVSGAPSTMIGLLAAGEAGLEMAQAAASAPTRMRMPRADVTLLAPIPRPGKIVCVGYNYQGHGGDGPVAPEFPEIFVKTSNVVVGPEDVTVLPAVSTQVDYEGEMAIVIGATAQNVSRVDARGYIAGYTVFNDVSARDIQKRGTQWVLGKSFDTFGPMGPAIVTHDEVGEPHAQTVTVACNGETTVRASTADMIFTVEFLVSYLSSVMTLEPGDIIATGTPGKLPEAGAQNRFLAPGDVVTVTFDRIGTLSTTFVAEP
ncbi:fumarylacetoacetate hydrolase family protein [Demequina lutea]|uniref:Acylpyruvate hydrolase n=1 Tax=Demequina lutea TaxID=431489 RepID=A0A7Y9ZDC3_9MICO|nr:fumarylacetoacetate hydrolase family protein [Demequina lutea]NYI42173.1 acylpyruvate hydrolase [Demequina lutea]